MTSVLVRDRKHRDTEESYVIRKPEIRVMCASQGSQGLAEPREARREAWYRFSPEPPEGTNPMGTLILDFGLPEL